MINKRGKAEIAFMETGRLVAFSDGVFAIAITLLVLDLVSILHIETHEGLIKSLLNRWESFLAFFIGFSTILICWINHHHIFNYIEKVDSKLLWVNGFVLLAITFTPLPTAILAEYLRTEGTIALAIYGINYIIISIASYCITSYVYKKRLISEESREYFKCIILTFAYSTVYTLFALVVCFIYIPAAIVLYLILFAAFAFPGELAARLLKRRNLRKKKAIQKAANP
jgi:TMEM175 potassium channel family protein